MFVPTLFRVMEQPQATVRALCFGCCLFLDSAILGELADQYKQLENVDSVSVVGCGSSFNAATYGTKLLRHTGAFTNVSAKKCQLHQRK